LVEQSIEKDKVIRKLLHGESDVSGSAYCTPRTPDAPNRQYRANEKAAELEHFNFNSSFEVEPSPRNSDPTCTPRSSILSRVTYPEAISPQE
jgi:hypothetical protein